MTHPDADFTRQAAALVAANDRVPEQRAGEDVVPLREWHVSVLLSTPPHAYASNPRLTVLARTTGDIYDLVAEKYPSGVVMGIWPKRGEPTP